MNCFRDPTTPQMPAGRGGGAQQQLGPDPYTMMLFMQMQQNFQL